MIIELAEGDTLNEIHRLVDVVMMFKIQFRDGAGDVSSPPVVHDLSTFTLQNPHYDLDETSKSRMQRETLLHKLHALGIQFTRSLNMKVVGDDGKKAGEV
jgi:myo-inositol-1-phosphate synthase